MPDRCVMADADDGDKLNFLAGLEARPERYAVGVRTNFQGRVGSAVTSPVLRVDERLQSGPHWQWHTMRWRQGTKVWLRKKFVAVRFWRVTSGTGAGWSESSPREASRRSGGALGATCPGTSPIEELVGLAHRRYTIEPFREEAKDELGWDQYQR